MHHLIEPLERVIAEYKASDNIHVQADAHRLSGRLNTLKNPHRGSREDYAIACADAREAVREFRGNDDI